MLAQEPSIAETIVELDQFDAFGFPQGQFIGASGIEIIYSGLVKRD